MSEGKNFNFETGIIPATEITPPLSYVLLKHSVTDLICLFPPRVEEQIVTNSLS